MGSHKCKSLKSVRVDAISQVYTSQKRERKNLHMTKAMTEAECGVTFQGHMTSSNVSGPERSIWSSFWLGLLGPWSVKGSLFSMVGPCSWLQDVSRVTKAPLPQCVEMATTHPTFRHLL